MMTTMTIMMMMIPSDDQKENTSTQCYSFAAASATCDNSFFQASSISAETEEKTRGRAKKSQVDRSSFCGLIFLLQDNSAKRRRKSVDERIEESKQKMREEKPPARDVNQLPISLTWE